MDNGDRFVRQWHAQQLAAPWRSAMHAHTAAAEPATETAQRVRTMADEIESKIQNLDELWLPNTPDMVGSMKDTLTRKVRDEKEALEVQVQDLQAKFDESEKSRSTIQNEIETITQERDDAVRSNSDLRSQLQAAINKPRPGEASQEEFEKLRKKLEESLARVERIRGERSELRRSLREARRSTMQDTSRSDNPVTMWTREQEQERRDTIAREKCEALQLQKSELQLIHDKKQRKALRDLRTDLTTAHADDMRMSLEDQEQRLKTSFRLEKQQILQEQQHLRENLVDKERKALRDTEEKYSQTCRVLSHELQKALAGNENPRNTAEASKNAALRSFRQETEAVVKQRLLEDREQDPEQLQEKEHALTEKLTSTEAVLSAVSENLEEGARLLGVKLPDHYGLEERASKLAEWGLLWVSRSYRGPIERLCRKLDIHIGAWPDIGHEQHYEELADRLKKIVDAVKLRFKVQREHWLGEMLVVLRNANADVRSLESALDDNERLGHKVYSHFMAIDGENGLVANFLKLSDRSIKLIADQEAVIDTLQTRLDMSEDMSDKLEKALVAIMDAQPVQ